MMRIFSLNVGRPQIVVRAGRQYSTAIDRRPVQGRVALGAESLEGDRVSNRNVHGGPDKAVCCYPREHYSYFSGKLGRELAIPSFGENFTTEGLLESAVCVGDTYRVGSAIVQVSQPREPCFKLAGKLAEQRMIKWIHETGFCGFYVRVLQAGEVGAGDAFEILKRGHTDLTIARLLSVRVTEGMAPELWPRLAELPELAGTWRKHFAGRAAGETDDD